jgi:hypothetical protein
MTPLSEDLPCLLPDQTLKTSAVIAALIIFCSKVELF